MDDRNDQQLLRAYADDHSEAAFEALVRSHIDLVHSAARRMVRDPHHAEDVTQEVFTALAKQAPRLRGCSNLAGWLYRTTHHQAAFLIRSEMRRREREHQTGAMQNNAEEGPSWQELAEEVDDAMMQLSEKDRSALLLRFFQRKSARDIAATFGSSEPAAEKRLQRAMERLRGVLSARGVTVSAAGLASALAAKAVEAVPASLAASVSAASITAATSASSFPTIGLIKLMLTAKAKLIVGAAGSALVLGTIGVQQARLSTLRHQNDGLTARLRASATLLEAAENVTKTAANPADIDSLQREHSELMRLRDRVASFRRREADLARSQDETDRQKRLADFLTEAANLRLRGEHKSESIPVTPRLIPGAFQVAGLSNRGSETPEALAQTALHAIFNDDPSALNDLYYSPNLRPEDRDDPRSMESLAQAQRNQFASMRRMWNGAERITNLRLAHVRNSQYAFIFDFDYGQKGRPDGAPAGGDITMRNADGRWLVEDFGWRNSN